MVKGLANDHGAAIAAAHARALRLDRGCLAPRRGVPAAALEKLADADAFAGALGLDRRQALWAVRGAAATTPLPLFAARRRGPSREPLELVRR